MGEAHHLALMVGLRAEGSANGLTSQSPQHVGLSSVLELWQLRVPEGSNAPGLSLGNLAASVPPAPFLPEPPPESLKEVWPSFSYNGLGGGHGMGVELWMVRRA